MIKKRKNAQITLFVIIALILVILIISYLFIKPNIAKGNIQSSEEESSAKNIILSCIEKEGYRGLYFLGEKAETINANFEGDYYLPTKEEFGLMLSDYISKNLRACIILENKSFIITPSSSPKVKSEIYEKTIEIYADYPVNVRAGEISSVLEKFNTRLDAKFGFLWDIAEAIKNSYLTNEKSFSITHISLLEDNYGIITSINNNDEENYALVELNYPNAIKENIPCILKFLLR